MYWSWESCSALLQSYSAQRSKLVRNGLSVISETLLKSQVIANENSLEINLIIQNKVQLSIVLALEDTSNCTSRC